MGRARVSRRALRLRKEHLLDPAQPCRHGAAPVVRPPSASGQRGAPARERRDDWFEVYRAADGVFAIAEPHQFQEVISYLIVGSDRALMFDTGLGLAPIRPVVEQLTSLPVEVLNSHTHFDHVGGNAEFDRIAAMDTPYTRANARGFGHEALAGEVAPSSFCKGPPKDADTAGSGPGRGRRPGAWPDGDRIDLGGRVLEVLHVPGHTPDALALLDRGNGLLWTGDSYYDGTIWLYVPETSLDDYERSMTILASVSVSVPALKHAPSRAQHGLRGPEAARPGEGRDPADPRRLAPGEGGVGQPGRVHFRRLLDPRVAAAARGENGRPEPRRVRSHDLAIAASVLANTWPRQLSSASPVNGF